MLDRSLPSCHYSPCTHEKPLLGFGKDLFHGSVFTCFVYPSQGRCHLCQSCKSRHDVRFGYWIFKECNGLFCRERILGTCYTGRFSWPHRSYRRVDDNTLVAASIVITYTRSQSPLSRSPICQTTINIWGEKDNRGIGFIIPVLPTASQAQPFRLDRPWSNLQRCRDNGVVIVWASSLVL